ncbi:sensor histidine kinase [Flavobacterium enshiense]|uniref:histidine kinase n=1 Tax=Flavobacterium enshiense DK69 TaxID=1107311 RepID=A0A0A2MWF9_9FLAO|nr:ATP-binding protein [Flavobacterium enshiense]KGO96649.1 histidine kinase [Flavobacterium enshiense DK69]
MLNFSFKNRIAFNYILSTALLVFMVFFVIFSIVKLSIYSHINSEIEEEIKLHLEEMTFSSQKAEWIDKTEWKEREHKTIAVNPIFVEITDVKGKTIEKSPNLKQENLLFISNLEKKHFYDTKLKDQNIRLSQTPIIYNNVKKGFLLIGMSLEDSTMVLNNLKETLFILYPLIMIILFIMARIIAGKSIKPVSTIIETTERITKDNLSHRIELPSNKDELYTLSNNINNLLDRIENSVAREKQFTSDASHELRTPLAVIKGTLEVLIRKPRAKEEYETKIQYCISEVNRLNNLVDELLLLARFENQKQLARNEDVLLNSVFLDVITRFSPESQSKNISVTTDFSQEYYVKTDSYLLSIVISNLISNALKYTHENGNIAISISKNNDKTLCIITDNGIGIKEDDLPKIFEQFYRSDASAYHKTKGTGLGLSIVKKLCLLLNIQIEIKSKINEGTEVLLIFE